MSDNFEMLVDVEATSENAERLSRAVLDRLRQLDLIVGEANADCVLGGTGYRPGPAVPSLYICGEREGRFWELRTCGVEPKVGRSFNYWALGPVCEGFTCSQCRAVLEPFGAEFGDFVGKAFGEWLDRRGPGLLRCPRCAGERSIAEWQCKPPLGMGYLSFRFWNWPPLNSPEWKVDIGAIIREATGHKIVRTYGHI
ncbi:MAG TPA: hypothetical protein VMS17_02840 [Gemmataceae bacterium]|nr:hypothetical protein [Gemmataceae bacterium]